MREILFRGKTQDGKWVEGIFYPDCLESIKGQNVEWGWIKSYRLTGEYGYVETETFEVIRETVGQFTGLTDKNRKKIFEGDIVKYTRKNMYAPETGFHKQDIVSIHKIYWDNSNFRFSQEHYDLESKRCIGGGNITFTDWRAKEEEIEVIGNVHDNPKLLEVGNGK